jgi:transcriptional regulator GlxA family with amidase domain
MTVHVWSEHLAEACDTWAQRSGLSLVQQAEMLALAGFDKPLSIATLCDILTVSERTLRKAFRITRGRSPCRHLRTLRLRQVRESLMSPQDGAATVTEIATTFGFVELGRFSVEYRRLFGESPSVTLRRALSAMRERTDPAGQG